MTCANHPDRERIAYCQNCGKPLCQECMRSVGTAIYCEPCLAAKLAGAPASGPGSASYSDPVSGVYAAGPQSGGGYAYQGPVPGSYVAGALHGTGAPNPMLAGLLGFIPGVGAMYNEQYAKGIVHLIVFAVLVSLADSHGIFGLFIAGWVFYMVIEAHHTARARRDGLPLPNPFGLNDLGERLGFGKSWPSGTPNPTPMPPDPYAPAYTPAASSTGEAGTTGAGTTGAGAAAPYAPATPGAVPPNWGVPPIPPWQSYAPPVPPMAAIPLDDKVPYPGNRFPAGAIWLIALGGIFLIANAGIFGRVSGHLFVPFILIGLAVFVFVKKMTAYGGGLSDDGTAGYRLRLFRAMKGSAWLALVGVLFFLDESGILSWGHSWPLFIILGGIMTVLQRTAFNSAAAPVYTQPGYGGPQPGYGAPQPGYGSPQPGYGTPYGYSPQAQAQTPPAPAEAGPFASPDHTRDQEGR